VTSLQLPHVLSRIAVETDVPFGHAFPGKLAQPVAMGLRPTPDEQEV
jgi:hypothetical protein